MNNAFILYEQGLISLGKLAEILNIPLEAVISELKALNICIDLGLVSEKELLEDINNA